MRENVNFVAACCLLWFGVVAIAYLGDSTTGFVLALFILPAAAVGWIVLFVIAVIRLFLRAHLPLSKRMVPLWFLTVPVLVYAVVGTAFSEIRKENTWLTIKRYDFHGSENFRFMKDGTYTQWRESPLGSSAEGNGRYERQDSILILHPKPAGDKAQEFKVVIRPYSEFKRQQSSPVVTLVTLDTAAHGY